MGGDDMMEVDIIAHDLISMTPETTLDTHDTCQEGVNILQWNAWLLIEK